MSSFLLAAQVSDVLDAEGILTYDFPPSELQEEVDDTIDTELEDILVFRIHVHDVHIRKIVFSLGCMIHGWMV